MAFYGIPGPGAALTASTAADTIQLFNNSTAILSANTVIALDGNDIVNFGAEGRTSVASATITLTGASGGTGHVVLVGSASYTASAPVPGAGSTTIGVTGVITSERAVRSIIGSQIYGNSGADSIALGDSLTTLSASTIGGGAGNDVIGTYTYVNQQWTAAEANSAIAFSNTLVDGGGDNDRILFDISGTFSTASVQGGAGNDSITFSAQAADKALLAAGGGDDVISGTFTNISAVSIAGGGGNDTIIFSGADVNLAVIAGDIAGTQNSTFDGSDYVSVNADSASSTTVVGLDGNDTILISASDAGANLYAGNSGNDSISIGALLSASSVQGGAGNDSIIISAGALAGTQIVGGGDNDTIYFGADAASGALYAASTVYGGQGADVFSAGTVSGGATIGITFGYTSYDDSTLSAMDSIAIGNSTTSGSYVLNFDPAGLSLGTFSATNGTVTATNGVVTFTSTFDSDVTSRVAAIDSNLTTVGGTVTFLDGSGGTYVFIQGGSTDLVTKVSSATTASNAGITLAGGKTITLNLA